MMILVSQAAKILEISKRAVRKRVNSGIIEGVRVPGVGRGGCQLRIILESTAALCRAKWHSCSNSTGHSGLFVKVFREAAQGG